MFDVGVIYMTYKISKSSHASLLYALHPAMIIIIAIHGQLDSLVLFFFLLSIIMFQQKTTFSGLLLGIAISIKPWPILFLPSFLKKTTQKISYFLLSCFSPVMSVVFHSFLTGVPVGDIITPIKNYRGIYGIWGIGNIMNTLFPLFWEQNIRFFRRLFLVLFVGWQFVNHKKTFLEELFLTLLVFFSFSPLFGAQWLSWIIPFLC
ncbi:MAG: glycosyltransferase 87 family protein, partial [Candidatus Calescibacterium sp.]|nr:glycosyltransferase 87 family protein [Candidatus Calescibacterium sp.]